MYNLKLVKIDLEYVAEWFEKRGFVDNIYIGEAAIHEHIKQMIKRIDEGDK